jgi:hypothetical protein
LRNELVAVATVAEADLLPKSAAILILKLVFRLAMRKTVGSTLAAKRTQDEQALDLHSVYPSISQHHRHLSG